MRCKEQRTFHLTLAITEKSSSSLSLSLEPERIARDPGGKWLNQHWRLSRLTLQIHLKHGMLILTSSPSFVHGSRYPAVKESERETKANEDIRKHPNYSRKNKPLGHSINKPKRGRKTDLNQQRRSYRSWQKALFCTELLMLHS